MTTTSSPHHASAAAGHVGAPAKLPLSGVRIIDLTRILSGPFCTMILADMGADVVKIEDPNEGDPIRNIGAGHDGISWYFAAFNRNKRSLALDVKSAEGRQTLLRLLAHADVLVENYRPGVLARMGLDQATLDSVNPRLVVASINGYGSTGPYADRPAFDFVIQAMSGFMTVNGHADAGPVRCAPPITDLIAGLYGAFGVVSALRARDLTGEGQRVESAMMSTMISMFAFLASDYLATGRLPVKTGNDHPIASPYGLFTASDGEIAVAPSTDAILRRLLSVLGIEEILELPRFSSNEQRLVHRSELNQLINERLRTDTQANWIARLNAAGVPCGKVQDIGQALADPQMVAQEMVIEVDHPGHGPVKMLGFPVKLSKTPCVVRHPAPGHGEHTAEILAELAAAEAKPRA
jgi:CoA:oxalate CoA-transferase